MRIKSVFAMVGLLPLAACGGSTGVSTPSLQPPPAVGSDAPKATPSAAQDPGVRVTLLGYVYSLKQVGPIQLQTTITELGQEVDAPPGQKYGTVVVAVTNTSRQRENLKFDLLASNRPQGYFFFEVGINDAVSLGAAYPCPANSIRGCQPGTPICNLLAHSDPSRADLCSVELTVDSLSMPVDFPDSLVMAPGDVENATMSFGPVPATAPLGGLRLIVDTDGGWVAVP